MTKMDHFSLVHSRHVREGPDPRGKPARLSVDQLPHDQNQQDYKQDGKHQIYHSESHPFASLDGNFSSILRPRKANPPKDTRPVCCVTLVRGTRPRAQRRMQAASGDLFSFMRPWPAHEAPRRLVRESEYSPELGPGCLPLDVRSNSSEIHRRLFS